MRIRIGKKLIVAVSVCAGALAAIVIGFSVTHGKTGTNMAGVGELIEDDNDTLTTQDMSDMTGIGSLAGLAAGVSEAPDAQQPEVTQPSQEETQAADTTDAQPEQAAPAQQQSRAQIQSTTGNSNATGYTYETTIVESTPVQSQRQTGQQAQQPAAASSSSSSNSNSNADKFRGQPGAGSVDVGGNVNSDEAWYSSGASTTPTQPQEAFGGGISEYVDDFVEE